VLALQSDLAAINQKEINFSDNNLIGQRVFSGQREFIVIARPKDLLLRHLENFEQHFDQVWAIEVMEVFLAEIFFVPSLYSAENEGLILFECVFDQLSERHVRDGFYFIHL
jgi:hypothetical protein